MKSFGAIVLMVAAFCVVLCPMAGTITQEKQQNHCGQDSSDSPKQEQAFSCCIQRGVLPATQQVLSIEPSQEQMLETESVSLQHEVYPAVLDSGAVRSDSRERLTLLSVLRV